MATTHPKKRPILLVDDEPEMLRSLQSLLRLDFEVHVASSGAEALEILKQHPIHVVMTDQRMPRMTGVEFLSHAKSLHPEAIRVIFTGYAEISAVVDAINHGHVFRYVTKPWDPGSLPDIFHEAGSQHDLLSERRRLLIDIRDHEEQCLAFADQLRASHGNTIVPESAARLEQLTQSGRSLLAHLEATLAIPNAGLLA